MSHVEDRPAPALLDRDQFRVHLGQVGERVAAGFHKGREGGQIAAVELDQAPAPQALGDQRHIAGAHGQERQERQAGPEVHRREPAGGEVRRFVALEAVRLTLQRPPLVLPRELPGAHGVQEFDEIAHEYALGPELGRAQPLAVAARAPRPAPEGRGVVVDLQKPRPAVDPFAQLAAAPEDGIDEGRQDADDGPFAPEPEFRAAPDQRLP